MAAKMVIPQVEADTGFGLLKDIIEMVKNPDAIDEAYQRRLDAVKLNEAEIKKSEEARALIAQADAVKEQQQQEWARIAATKIEHDGAIKVFGDHVLKDNVRFNEWEYRLTEKQKLQEATDSRHAQERRGLEAQAKEAEAAYAEKLADYDKRIETIFQTEAEQKKEGERLVALAAKLKTKAARIVAEAQKDD